MTTRQAVAAEHLGEAKTTAWAALRAFNQGAASADEFSEAAATVNIACEQYRRRYHPRAAEVFVLCDTERGQGLSIYARSAAGRTKQVWPPTAES